MSINKDKIKQLEEALETTRKEFEDALKANTRTNGFAEFVALQGGNEQAGLPYMSTDTLNLSTRMQLISLDHQLLSRVFISQGLLKKAIELPVDDAYSKPPMFFSGELSAEQNEQLNTEFQAPRLGLRNGTQFLSPNNVYKLRGVEFHDAGPSYLDTCKLARKWIRLYGGGGILINTQQPFETELTYDNLEKDALLELLAVDKFELPLVSMDINKDQPYNFYGMPVHRSRVIKQNNIEAPSLYRSLTMGWGISDLESVIPAVNAALKYERLLFELLDEAKIDVYRIKGFANLLGTATGAEMAHRRMALTNQLKSTENALVLDAEDEYIQKQINFSNYDKIYNEIRRNLSAYMNIPMGKLFGEAAGGFGSGDDSLENYNQVLSIERNNSNPLLIAVGRILCKILFGYVPNTLTVKWQPLRILSGLDEQTVLTNKHKRLMDLFDRGLLSSQEVMILAKNEGLVEMETEVFKGERVVEPGQYNVKGGNAMGGKNGGDDYQDSRDKDRAMKKDHRERR